MMVDKVQLGSQKLAGQNRIRLVSMIFCVFFLMIAVQLGKLTLMHKVDVAGDVVLREKSMPRPDIVDRNGQVMATDIEVSSLLLIRVRSPMWMKPLNC
jgi:cell division protein FtsI (penicillin-binding protein 3)